MEKDTGLVHAVIIHSFHLFPYARGIHIRVVLYMHWFKLVLILQIMSEKKI